MVIEKYKQLRKETRNINRCLDRINLCVEALKSRIGDINRVNLTKLESVYGKELLLILQNYLIQKYYKKYNLLTEESYMDERLFFYSYNHVEDKFNIAGVLDMLKGKYYLSEHIKKNNNIFTSIVNYGYDGFEEIEKQIVDNCSKMLEVKENINSEITLTLYQLVTIGNCLGYFDFIIISDELPSNEKFLMEEFKRGKFLIRLGNKKFYIDKFKGELILSNNIIIDYDKWCNHDVGNGLEFLLSLK